MVDSYPIPRPEDLYQALRGWKTFTKLDLSDAYLQVELDEESKRILVINTHKGLYQYNRLPFGVASAPAIFQKIMNTMLAGIPNVAAYLDDIILTGATDDELLRKISYSGKTRAGIGQESTQKRWKELSDGTVKVIAHASKDAPMGNTDGRERMVSMARQFCWWPAMNKDIEMKAQSCEGCAIAQKNPAKVAVKPWEVADRPCKRIHVDFAGPVNGKMFLIVADAHSKWPEVLHMPHITTEQTIESLKTVFARFGFPEVLVSDNGTQFTATEFTIFCPENGICHVTSAPYQAQSNGQVERFIDTFKRALKKSTNDRRPRIFNDFSCYSSPEYKANAVCDNLEEQKRKMENTSGNRADRQFKIVGQQGQVTWFVQVGRMRWKRHTNQMRHKNTGIADGQEEQDNDVDSLLDEALPAGNSPERNAAADENVQDTEKPNIFQDQTSTPPKGSVDSPKATVHAESSSTTVETGDREHKPDGSVTIKQDEVLQKPHRSNRVRKPPNRLSI
ncbi:Uncharacterized protein T06_16072 [Trichinella sp. T6]|nr:Uncharacterized protein T06_16072 [Trichinella sp. T6]